MRFQIGAITILWLMWASDPYLFSGRVRYLGSFPTRDACVLAAVSWRERYVEWLKRSKLAGPLDAGVSQRYRVLGDYNILTICSLGS